MRMRKLYAVSFLSCLSRFICIFYLFLGYSVVGDVSNTVFDTYIISDIKVNGNVLLDKEVIIDITGLKKGEKIQIPSTIQEAIRRLWKQQLISNVSIYASDCVDDTIVLNIDITESARLSKWICKGVKKDMVEKLEEHIALSSGMVITESLLKNTTDKIKQYFLDKGFFNVIVSIIRIPDVEKKGFEQLEIKINSGEKVIINKIIIVGNHRIDSQVLKQTMQGFNEKPRLTLLPDLLKKIITLQPFRKNGFLRKLPSLNEFMHYMKTHVILFASEFTQARYDKIKENLLSYYQSQGFRDAKIIKTRIDQPTPGQLNLYFKVEEGTQYIIKSIKWVGNYIHNTQELNEVLNIYPKDVFDPVLLKKQLMPTMEEKTIGSLYMNDGYLFFRGDLVEVGIDGNQVSLEIRLQEGPRAVINKISIAGNTITHESVIRRELVTFPGDQFSFSKIVQSIRNLSMLNLFSVEKLQFPDIIPNPLNGTVDIIYNVVEKPDLKLGAKCGFGGGGLAFSFSFGINNFSIDNLLKFKKPVGDAQQCDVNIEKGDQGYTNFSFSFLEPWLGGKAPNSLCVKLSHSFQKVSDKPLTPRHNLAALRMHPLFEFKTEDGSIRSTGGSVSFGKMLRWPSEYWKHFFGMDFYYKKCKMVPLFPKSEKSNYEILDLNFHYSLKRNSTNHPVFPSRGWTLGINITTTPPYSFIQQYKNEKEKYKFKEYHKWMIDFSWFKGIIGDLVLHLGGNFGIIGDFSTKKDNPFCRFSLGGSKRLGTDGIFDQEHIALRGYPEDALTPKKGKIEGGIMYDKFVSELRYPILLSSRCSIYLLTFFETAGNWFYYSDYTPLDMKKSVGGGIRIQLPILLGLLPDIALDCGYRLDDAKSINPNRDKLEFHFAFDLGGR